MLNTNHSASIVQEMLHPLTLTGHAQLTSLSLWDFVFLILSGIQCALMHPKFQHSHSARIFRRSLGPLTIPWWICSPYYYAYTPIATNALRNAMHAMIGSVMVFKAVDWTFSNGPFHMRSFKYIEGVPQWDKGHDPELSKEDCGFVDVASWTLRNFASLRGLEFSWGISGAIGSAHKSRDTVMKILSLLMVVLPCSGFALLTYCTQSRSPVDALLTLCFPMFPGIHLLASCMLSASYCFAICAGQELQMCLFTLANHFIHPLARQVGLPAVVCDFFDPARCTPVVNSLFNLSSIAYFWGKSWHQMFRRGYIVCGLKPGAWVSRCLGASPNLQKVIGALSVFFFSGIQHEYPLWVVLQKPWYRIDSFTGVFMFFFVQSIAVIVEPFIIPHIPRWLGGGRLWTVLYLLVTTPLLTGAIQDHGGYVDLIRQLS